MKAMGPLLERHTKLELLSMASEALHGLSCLPQASKPPICSFYSLCCLPPKDLELAVPTDLVNASSVYVLTEQ